MKLVSAPIKEQESVGDWTSVEQSLPPQARELYIVVQDIGGNKVRAAAFFEEDGNGEWKFNKEGVTHWMKWPQMPK